MPLSWYNFSTEIPDAVTEDLLTPGDRRFLRPFRCPKSHGTPDPAVHSRGCSPDGLSPGNAAGQTFAAGGPTL